MTPRNTDNMTRNQRKYVEDRRQRDWAEARAREEDRRRSRCPHPNGTKAARAWWREKLARDYEANRDKVTVLPSSQDLDRSDAHPKAESPI